MTKTTQPIALITAGAKGIGRAICHAFHEAGFKLYFVDIDSGAGHELAGILPNSTFINCDIAKQDQTRDAVAQIVKSEQHIDVLVNNAGISKNTEFLGDEAIEAFDAVINVNLRGTFLFSHYAAKYMKNGSIINISSTRALQSEANTEAYSASKGGILALTHAMAMSLSAKKIRVNAVLPGWIDVQHHQSELANKPGSAHAKAYEITESDHAQHPAGRVGIPEDIAKIVLFLADNDQSGFITAQNFIVDGGMTKKMIYV